MLDKLGNVCRSSFHVSYNEKQVFWKSILLLSNKTIIFKINVLFNSQFRDIREKQWLFTGNQFTNCSQLSPCGHLAITDTPIIRTAAKSPAK